MHILYQSTGWQAFYECAPFISVRILCIERAFWFSGNEPSPLDMYAFTIIWEIFIAKSFLELSKTMEINHRIVQHMYYISECEFTYCRPHKVLTQKF